MIISITNKQANKQTTETETADAKNNDESTRIARISSKCGE
jgi:hypothetical protein